MINIHRYVIMSYMPLCYLPSSLMYLWLPLLSYHAFISSFFYSHMLCATYITLLIIRCLIHTTHLANTYITHKPMLTHYTDSVQHRYIAHAHVLTPMNQYNTAAHIVLYPTWTLLHSLLILSLPLLPLLVGTRVRCCLVVQLSNSICIIIVHLYLSLSNPVYNKQTTYHNMHHITPCTYNIHISIHMAD
jgi:hypothetical protein